MTTQADQKTSKFRGAFRIFALSVFIASVILTLFAECERANWTLYLVAQFRLQLFALTLLTAAVFGVLEYPKKWIVVATICALLNGREIFPLYLSDAHEKPQNAQTLKLLQINLNSKNREFQRVISYIHKVNPDVLLISELTPTWVEAFQKSLPEYPDVTIIPREDTYGIGLYSKQKVSSARVEYFGAAGYPSVVANLSNLEKPITVLHTHIQGPVKDHLFEWHKDHIEKMTEVVSNVKLPLIVSGDTNSNTWTYLLADFLKTTKLRDSRKGHGVQLTWPTPNYWRHFPLTILAIDHFFVSKEINVIERKTGEEIGSDHFPVILECSLSRQ
jgi:endonuclease/exonuclease/phosphatase (EEP) superfamily protein YafD